MNITIKQIPIKFFNTQVRTKEVLSYEKDKPLLIYTCGPTVYDFAHIGNFRTYIFEDLLRRTLKFFGIDFVQVMNITDIDDKTIKGAIKKGCTLDEYTKPYKKAFFDDLNTLNIEKVEHYPAATEYVEQMIEVVQDLLEKGYAYKGGDGSIYYSIAKFADYGKLSNLNMDELKAGASERVISDEYDKENVADFVLWKAYDEKRDGQTFWDSPFGKGRPGWHIECSTMANSLLGKTIDIHCGGVDNIFPHHENEIAQSEAFTGQKFVNHWMHSEHLIVDNKKMSKSLGNFFTLRTLISKGYRGPQIRYMLLHTHYKTKLNFTLDGLQASGSALQRLNDFIQRMNEIDNELDNEKVDHILQKALDYFAMGLADDLNISHSLSAVFDMVREINALCDKGEFGFNDAKKVLHFMKKIDSVLGVLDFEEIHEIPKELTQALNDREVARNNKVWKEADRLRDFIHEKGFVIEDTSKGPRLKKA